MLQVQKDRSHWPKMKANANAKWQIDRFLKIFDALLNNYNWVTLKDSSYIGRLTLKNKSESKYFSSMFAISVGGCKIQFAKNSFRSNLVLFRSAKFSKRKCEFDAKLVFTWSLKFGFAFLSGQCKQTLWLMEIAALSSPIKIPSALHPNLLIPSAPHLKLNLPSGDYE